MDVRVVLDPDEDADAEAVERLVRQLRAEIAELDVDSVRAEPAGDVPDGAKGADPLTVGALLVALSASGGVFPSLIATLRDWLGRHSGRHRVSVTVGGDTIELDQATPEQQHELVAAFLARHAAAP